MSYRTVQVEIPHRQAEWFERRGAAARAAGAPVAVASVQVNEKTAVVAGERFVLRRLGDGFCAVFRDGGGALPIGEFSPDTVRHTISDKAAKEVRLLRAAVLDLAYEAPVAYLLPDGELVHPGACHRRRPFCVVKKLKRVTDEDATCAACGGGFE